LIDNLGSSLPYSTCADSKHFFVRLSRGDWIITQKKFLVKRCPLENRYAAPHYEPFGDIFSSEGTSPTHHKYTGQENDSETGLDFYNARYYDPTLGRFISQDSIVPSAMDPQALNRYAYVRNNPLTLVDPTGHSWLSNNFSKIAHEVVPFVSPLIAPNWTVQSVKANRQSYIPASIAFITSGGNPITTVAAFATEMGMQTGEGREVTNHVAKEVFVDVFALSPQNANICSNIAIRMAAMAAMEDTWSQISPNQLQAIPLPEKPENIEGGSAGSVSPFGPSASNGGGEGEQYYGLFDSNGDQEGTAMDRPLQDIYRISSPLQIDHTGINMVGYNEGSVPGPLYGSWGVCHTAANRTLFQAGYGSTVSSLGIGGWTTHVTAVIYGNYGGGLYRAAYWGYEANH